GRRPAVPVAYGWISWTGGASLHPSATSADAGRRADARRRMIAAMKIAYFTAGTVGAGHLVRGLAIGRGLRRAGFRGAYRMFGPRLPFAAAGREDHVTVDVQTDRALRDRHLAQMSGLAQELQAFDPDLLLVDMFWAPLRWVLPALSCEA